MTARNILMAAAGASGPVNYIEDVFSTHLYTGNGSTQTITNGIDLAGKGGLVWFKSRNNVVQSNHLLIDTGRTPHPTSGGVANLLRSNLTDASSNGAVSLSWKNDGFDINLATNENWASWTFRKQPKFFDVVTYTGNGSSQNIPHNLGSVPGCIIVKCTSAVANWCVYHQGTSAIPQNQRLQLNLTDAVATSGTAWNGTAPTATQFSVGNFFNTNGAGNTYVAYIFAHDAGGFGLTGTDNVISCGAFTTDGSGNATINLGYEPQWLMTKSTNTTGNWVMVDVMRGWAQGNNQNILKANLFDAEEANSSNLTNITATGLQSFSTYLGANNTYIYIAIRRGPMKTPTSGTSVFSPILSSSSGGVDLTTNFPVDLQITGRTGGTTSTTKGLFFDRLRGVSTTVTGSGQRLMSHSTSTETTLTNGTLNWGSTGFQMPGLLGSGSSIFWNFRRAPGFFDEVCYTGNDVSRNLNHNLGVAPQLWIVKARSTSVDWSVGSSLLASTTNDYLALNLTDAKASFTNFWNTPTSTTFGFGNGLPSAANINASGHTYVAYLFASCPGVSKVGSYTGTGTTQQINCGFTAGSRFVLIKRTDSTGDWYVWDSARGIVAGNDPYLLLNSTAAEVTTTDYIDTYSAGFEISSTAPAAINASGGSFIYLAIA